MEDLLEAGNAYRTTESTKLNAVSSRSHAVLQLRVDTGGRQQGRLGARVGDGRFAALRVKNTLVCLSSD